jgi:RNA polymerase sigma-70 factor (ECF subfamily)
VHVQDQPTRPDQPIPPGNRSGPPSDVDLLTRLEAGDTYAMRLLYERYARPAHSLAQRICRNQSLAEDVVQEVFLVLWCQSSRYTAARGTFRAWLLTVVHHKAVDAVRREHSVSRLLLACGAACEDRSNPSSAGSDENAVESVIAGQVREAIRRLPLHQRQALLLAYYGDYTQREISELLGVPLGTVKSRMVLGARRLRILLRSLRA